ncbi:hypothetical protein ONZ45_g3520 [Pleurotus djamor]|nr:hypothetical protein ONZ45_g3520 [Pleurotus djamor]
MTTLTQSLSRLFIPALFAALVAYFAPSVFNISSQSSSTPGLVSTGAATFVGLSAGKVSKFLGIPYAKPPIGDARLRVPQPIDPYVGSIKADAFGPACSQQARRFPIPDGMEPGVLEIISNLTLVPDGTSEDCLTLNIITPSQASPTSKYPVLVWVHGGKSRGFTMGSSKIYDGSLIVERSMEMGEPILYVSVNYRLSALGFLSGREVKEAGIGNLGLRDQREALRWIQTYITFFGGDPQKVTIWGESAGANSVAFQMLANDGDSEGLFRGAFMQSGTALPTGDYRGGQVWYDALVEDAGCAGSDDTLACLRRVPYETFKAAMDKSPSLFHYRSVSIPWFPRADGGLVTDTPQKLVREGKIANIPFVSGTCDDEATMFSFSTLNVTTSEEFKQYIKEFWLPHASEEELERVLTLYPADITQGSPYGTGSLYALTPQYKRLASFQGDITFQAPRRFFMKELADTRNTWAYLNKRLKLTPILGSYHMTDLYPTYGYGELMDSIIHFSTTLDPNGAGQSSSSQGARSLPFWPKYTTGEPVMLTLVDTGFRPSTSLSLDDYREEGIELLGKLMYEHPL